MSFLFSGLNSCCVCESIFCFIGSFSSVVVVWVSRSRAYDRWWSSGMCAPRAAVSGEREREREIERERERERERGLSLFPPLTRAD